MLIIERRYGRKFTAEIRAASVAMLASFARSGAIPSIPEGHEQRLLTIYRDMVAFTVQAFGSRILGQGKAMGRDLERKDFLDYFLRLSEEYISLEMIRRRITKVSETTREDIVTAINRTRQDADSFPAIAEAIARAVPRISKTRGLLIARTEVHGAANYGAHGAAKETGLDLQKEWVAVEDDRTRTSHSSIDEQVRELDEPFDVGGERLMYPGDPNGSAGNIINCRCSISHIVKD